MSKTQNFIKTFELILDENIISNYEYITKYDMI